MYFRQFRIDYVIGERTEKWFKGRVSTSEGQTVLI